MEKDLDLRVIIETAFDEAAKATANYLAKHGDADCCGFSWVSVSPGTSKVARILKEYGGRKGYGERGITVWNPSKSMTQSLTAKETGSDAFANILRTNFPTLEVHSLSRMD